MTPAEKELRMLLRAWDNGAGRLKRFDVESLAEWILCHDYKCARPYEMWAAGTTGAAGEEPR